MKSRNIALQLSLLVAIVPAIGATNEFLLQDSLKSMIVSIGALLIAAIFFCTHTKSRPLRMRLHVVQLLPLALMVSAVVSTLWSHTYLATVESIRWFVFSVLLFLGINSFSRQTLAPLMWGIHIGTFVASLWVVLQFLTDFKIFPQGPAPASTFVNRNLFAEYAVCAFPFSAFLLTRVHDKSSALILSVSVGFNATAILMTGTRSALVALILIILLIPCIIWIFRQKLQTEGWRTWHYTVIISIFLLTIFSIGSIDSNSPKVIKELGRGDAIDRTLSRVRSISEPAEYKSGTFSVRETMWAATGRMIRTHPFAGVGAGAWEVQIPLYQEAGSQIEIDYYAHNDLLQLIAEFGVIGWLVLLGLLAYLCDAALRTISLRSLPTVLRHDGIERATALLSLLALLLVANAGFPLRTAGSTMLCAIALAILTASDKSTNRVKARPSVFRTLQVTISSKIAIVLGIALSLTLAAAVFVSFKTIECERALVSAIQKSLMLVNMGNPRAASQRQDIEDIADLVSKGIAINPHYRKLTPIVADSMANIGEWETAVWIWESVLDSRPNVVAIMANIARGYIQLENYSAADIYIERAKKIQPTAETLISLDVILWSLTGQEDRAIDRAQSLMNSGRFDIELLQATYRLGIKANRPDVAINALKLKIRTWPAQASSDWLKLGNIYDAMTPPNTELALQAYRASVNTSQTAKSEFLLQKIPEKYRSALVVPSASSNTPFTGSNIIGLPSVRQQ